MGILRSKRFSVGRGVIVAILAYVIAASGMLGAISRAQALEALGSGSVIICTMDGMTSMAADGSEPAKQIHPHQHCILCTAVLPAAEPAAEASAVEDGAPQPAARAPGWTYDAVLPAYAFMGWAGVRAPRAPPAFA